VIAHPVLNSAFSDPCRGTLRKAAAFVSTIARGDGRSGTNALHVFRNDAKEGPAHTMPTVKAFAPSAAPAQRRSPSAVPFALVAAVSVGIPFAHAASAAPPPPDAPDADAGMSMLEFIQAGGSIGYVIILLSLLALALAVVHLIRIRSSSLAPEGVVADLRDLLSARRVDEAIAYCEREDTQCFLTNVMRAGLLRYRRSPFGALELKAALEEAGQEQVSRLTRSTDGLALVASIAPMLGLLGTVVGINGAFATISSAQGFSRPDQLAGDISLALVTTIMGLVLAIPATSAVTYFRNKIERLAADIAVVVDELAIYVETPGQQQAQQQATQSQTQRPPATPGRAAQPSAAQNPPPTSPRPADSPSGAVNMTPPPRPARPDSPGAPPA